MTRLKSDAAGVWLTARWCAYPQGRPDSAALTEHKPWPLYAEIESNDELIDGGVQPTGDRLRDTSYRVCMPDLAVRVVQ